jgi:N6-adenosine-specific RNA methylase IME4
VFVSALSTFAENSYEEAKKFVKTFTRDLKRKVRDANLPEPSALETGPFGVVYADPPWRYDHAAKPNRAIENQYPTLTVEEICALSDADNFPNVKEDAALFLWATAPKLREALAVMDAWHFDYVTNAVWIKDKVGMGYWFRGRHELLLVGKRGSFSPPDEDLRPDSVVEFPRLAHSAKPGTVRTLIESMFPDVARVELFAREKAEGWAVWGNQA